MMMMDGTTKVRQRRVLYPDGRKEEKSLIEGVSVQKEEKSLIHGVSVQKGERETIETRGDYYH